MADVVSKAVRSQIMSRIRGKNTEPELRVLMGSGARMAKHLQALRELREANDRVLQRMQGAWAMG